jgi:hypothetical protein
MRIKPVYELMAFFMITNINKYQQNNQSFYQIFNNLPASHKIFSENCLLNVWNNQPYS